MAEDTAALIAEAREFADDLDKLKLWHGHGEVADETETAAGHIRRLADALAAATQPSDETVQWAQDILARDGLPDSKGADLISPDEFHARTSPDETTRRLGFEIQHWRRKCAELEAQLATHWLPLPSAPADKEKA